MALCKKKKKGGGHCKAEGPSRSDYLRAKGFLRDRALKRRESGQSRRASSRAHRLEATALSPLAPSFPGASDFKHQDPYILSFRNSACASFPPKSAQNLIADGQIRLAFGC